MVIHSFPQVREFDDQNQSSFLSTTVISPFGIIGFLVLTVSRECRNTCQSHSPVTPDQPSISLAQVFHEALGRAWPVIHRVFSK